MLGMVINPQTGTKDVCAQYRSFHWGIDDPVTHTIIKLYVTYGDMIIKQYYDHTFTLLPTVLLIFPYLPIMIIL